MKLPRRLQATPARFGQIAERVNVMTCNIEGHAWGEVDFPADLERANKLVGDWA